MSVGAESIPAPALFRARSRTRVALVRRERAPPADSFMSASRRRRVPMMRAETGATSLVVGLRAPA